jgi:hypothetical protein
MRDDRAYQIHRRAHEIWEQEGRPHGKHDEHWQRATEEIEAEEALSGTEAGHSDSHRNDSSDPTPAASAPLSKGSRA